MKLSQRTILFYFVAWFFLVNAILFCVVGINYLQFILGSTSLYQNSIADYSSNLGKCFVLFFTIVNYLSYMMLLAVIPAGILVLVTFIIPLKRFIMVMSVILASCGLLLIIADAQIYGMFKFHLNGAIWSLLKTQQWRAVFDFSYFEMVLLFGLVALVFLGEVLLAIFVLKKMKPQNFTPLKRVSVVWLGALLFSYFTLMLSIAQNNNLFSQQIPNLPLFNQLFAATIPDVKAKKIILQYSEHHFAQPLFSQDRLHYPLHPLMCGQPKPSYNVILIMVDSLRFDSLDSQYMPFITKYAEHAVQFQHHISGGNATQPALFSLFYGLPSSYWTAALQQKKRPLLIDLFKQYQYKTKVIWSSEMHNPPFDKTLFLNLPELNINGAPGDDVGNWDRHTTRQAIKFLKNTKQENPFFLHVFYDAPHGYCRKQSFPSIYKPVHRWCARVAMSNDMDPVPYYHRYLNAVRFVDTQIAKLLKLLEEKGYFENSIVIFTSDHGQEFNDHQQNYWGHAGNFTKVQVQVPLVIFWPGETPRHVEYTTTSYDLVPTLMQRLFSCKNDQNDYTIGQSLFKSTGRLPFILTGSYVNMGIIENEQITTLETSGRITKMDMQARPLEDTKYNTQAFHDALTLMRRYFYR